MKFFVTGVLAVIVLLLFGAGIEAMRMMPWYYKLFIGAPAVLILYLLYVVARRKEE